MRTQILCLGKQFRDIPHAIRDACLNSGGNAQRAVDLAEVVIGEVQAERGPQIFRLLREAVGQASEAAHLHTHRQVLALHNRSADARRIGFSIDWDYLDGCNLARRISPFAFGVGAIDFDELSETANAMVCTRKAL